MKNEVGRKKCFRKGSQGELRRTEDGYDQDILYTFKIF